jgi:serine/threonine-protein kinase RsbW
MEHTIKIGSVLKQICEVEFFLNKIFKDLKISRKTYCKIYLATTEAVNNAIIHGNSTDSTKQVTINFTNNVSNYEVNVSDEGNGFDFFNVSDPTKPQNLIKESGRGIFIMRQYADKVAYNSSGNSVKLIFNK